MSVRGEGAGTVRFGVIGLNHDHIYDQTGMLLRAGAELVTAHASGARRRDGEGRADVPDQAPR